MALCFTLVTKPVLIHIHVTVTAEQRLHGAQACPASEAAPAASGQGGQGAGRGHGQDS